MNVLMTRSKNILILFGQYPSTMACSNVTGRPAAGAYELTEKLLATAHTDYDINYQGHLANHLPHSLYTLCVLGASTSRLQQFYDMYVQRLEPISKSHTTIDSSNWTTHIGKKNLYSDYLKFFDKEVESKGQKETFDLYFNQLMGESLGAALHPLINVGYSMEFQNPILLSEGLAYICIDPLQNTSKILNDSDTSCASVETTVVNLIEQLQGVRFPELNNDNWNFSEKTKFLLDNHWMVFKDLIAKWDLSNDDQLTAKLNELTEASILGLFGTYPKQIDFFLLHGLTGNHAVRIIFPHLSVAMQRRILKVNLLGLLTDYVVQGSPKIDVDFITGYADTKSDEILSWDVIIGRTILIDEEHVLKVVRSLIHYMETVPMSQRSQIFTEKCFKQCALKIVNLIEELNDYRF